MAKLRLGIDLGGTKIEGVLLDAGGQEMTRQRVPTPAKDYPATLKAVGQVVADLEKFAGVGSLPVGIGLPGSLAPASGLIRNANSTCLNGRAFGNDINALLERNVRLSNDANCLALSEARDGVSKGFAVSFAVILGTGVGAGIVVDGRILQGTNSLGGEFGHVPMPGEVADGPLCFCGRHGCNETYLSGPAIVRDYNLHSQKPLADLQAVSANALAGDHLAAGALARHRDRLGRALGAIVNIIDPDIFVIGGGVSNLPGLIENLPASITPHIFAPVRDSITINIARPKWGDSSGVRGAAQLWEAEA